MAEVLRRISKQGPPPGRPWGGQQQRWGQQGKPGRPEQHRQAEQQRRHVLTSQGGLEEVRSAGAQEWVLGGMPGKEK